MAQTGLGFFDLGWAVWGDTHGSTYSRPEVREQTDHESDAPGFVGCLGLH